MAERDDALQPGSGLVKLCLVGTALLVVTSACAAVGPGPFGPVHAVLSCLLFAVGTGGLLWAYAGGLARSRTDEVSVPGLFFLSGATAPPTIRLSFRAALLVEVLAVVAAASIRPYTAVAFGVLAPMFAMGLMAVWGARHGWFPPRQARSGVEATRSAVDDGGE